MRTYKIYATAGASANAHANVTLQRNGRIRGIRWSVAYDSSTDNGRCDLEASLVALAQIGTNDTIGSLDEVKYFTNLTTSGKDMAAVNVQRSVDIPVAAGERVYLNSANVSNCTFYATVFIDVAEGT